MSWPLFCRRENREVGLGSGSLDLNTDISGSGVQVMRTSFYEEEKEEDAHTPPGLDGRIERVEARHKG